MLCSAFKTYTELQRSRIFPTAKQGNTKKFKNSRGGCGYWKMGYIFICYLLSPAMIVSKYFIWDEVICFPYENTMCSLFVFRHAVHAYNWHKTSFKIRNFWAGNFTSFSSLSVCVCVRNCVCMGEIWEQSQPKVLESKQSESIVMRPISYLICFSLPSSFFFLFYSKV